MNQNIASASGRLRIFERLHRKDERGLGLMSKANLRPSQAKLDRLVEAAVRVPDRDIEAAISKLERVDYRRDKQRHWGFSSNIRLWPRKGSWTMSLNLGLFSIHRHFEDDD